MPDDARQVDVKPQPNISTLNLHQRLHAVMLDVDYVQKTHDLDFGGGRKKKVVTHDAVTAKVRPALVKHRVAYYPQNVLYQQNGNRTEVTMDVVFVNIDDPTDRIAVPTIGFGIDQGDKGPGKAMSYAVKYALLKALGLETGEDADLDADVKHDTTNVEPAPQKSPPGISKVKIEVREKVREIKSCSDGDELLAYLNKEETVEGRTFCPVKSFAVKVCRDYPQEWIGEEQGSGLKGMIQKAGDECGIAPTIGNWLRKCEEVARKSETTLAAG